MSDEVNKGGRPPKSNRDDVSVKYDRGLADQVQALAREKRVSIAEYLSDLTRNMVEQAYLVHLEQFRERISKKRAESTPEPEFHGEESTEFEQPTAESTPTPTVEQAGSVAPRPAPVQQARPQVPIAPRPAPTSAPRPQAAVTRS